MKKIILSLLVVFMSLPAMAGSRLDVCKSTVRLSEAYEWPDKYKKMIDETFVNPLPDAYKAQYTTGVGCTAKCEAGQKLIDCVTPQEHVTECAKIFASDYIEAKYRSQFEQELCGHIPESAETEADDIFKGQSISYWIADKEKKQGNSSTSSGTENKPTETKPAAAPAASANKEITVSGKVIGADDKQPVVYATVRVFLDNKYVEGKHVITDLDGNFTIQKVPTNAELHIETIQYETKIISPKENLGTIQMQGISLDQVNIKAKNAGKPCSENIIKALNAKSGKWTPDEKSNENYCNITCRTNYTKTSGDWKVSTTEFNTPNQPYKCICSGDFVEIGTECLPVSGCSKDKGVHESKYEKSGNTYECVVQSCDCGYTRNNGKCEKWDTSECTTMPENASKIERTCKNGAEFCEIKKCKCGYTLKNNQCVKMDADTCTKKPAHATKIGHACNDDVETCNVIECEKGWKPNSDGNACIRMLKKCTDEQLKEHPNASDTGIKEGTETCIATACKCGFKLDGEKCVEIPKNTPCDEDDLPKNASAGIKACKNGKPYCQITACLNETEYTHDTEKNRCEYLKGKTCTHTDTNADRAEWKNVDGKLVCTLKKCKSGFYVVDDKCEPSDGECTPEQLKQIEHAIKGERKKDKCTPTECEPGFEPSGKKCVEIAGKCETKPEHSKKSKRVFDETTKTEICQVVECEDGYRVSADGQKCEPSLNEKQAREKAAELRANADEMKAVEQSTENKLLGAAGIGAAGIGGMQVASALAEKNADEDAERDMAAYLATFRCDYGHGLNIKGGETGIELPGANNLIPLYQEYVNLANDLKVRKNALGMKPGIESEKILDAATSGLYDNQSIGKVDGAFTSLARALADPSGADAAEWAAQKDATAKKLKTGAIVAGVGIVGSAVGNAIINRNVDEKSDEIKRKYQPLKQVEKAPYTPQEPEGKCSNHDATGDKYPDDCVCNDRNKIFAGHDKGCIPCGEGREFNKESGKCECTDSAKEYDEDQEKCVCKPPLTDVNGKCETQNPTEPGCKLSGKTVQGKCECIANATETNNVCQCNANFYDPGDNTCVECKKSENRVVKDGKCICDTNNGYFNSNGTCEKCDSNQHKEINEEGQCGCKKGYDPDGKGGCTLPIKAEPVLTVKFKSDVLFDPGKHVLKAQGKEMLEEFKTNLKNAESGTEIDLKNDSDYCVNIIGKTDRTQYKNEKYKKDPTNPENQNMKLSLRRANAVKAALIDTVNENNMVAYGIGQADCTVANNHTKDNDPECRAVEVKLWSGSCDANMQNNTSGGFIRGIKDTLGQHADSVIDSLKK